MFDRATSFFNLVFIVYDVAFIWLQVCAVFFTRLCVSMLWWLL